MHKLNKFIMALSLTSGNYAYQYLSDYPDYAIAFDRSYYQAVAMIFIVFYPKAAEWMWSKVRV